MTDLGLVETSISKMLEDLKTNCRFLCRIRIEIHYRVGIIGTFAKCEHVSGLGFIRASNRTAHHRPYSAWDNNQNRQRK